MGHHGQHGGPGGPWGSWGQPWGQSPWGSAPWGRGGRPGPPPWVAGLFGLTTQGEQQRGPRARRGDVRAAILDVLQGEPLNGYQVISAISERTGGAWKPSPGSVYPTISQLEDEGLVEADDERGDVPSGSPTPDVSTSPATPTSSPASGSPSRSPSARTGATSPRSSPRSGRS